MTRFTPGQKIWLVWISVDMPTKMVRAEFVTMHGEQVHVKYGTGFEWPDGSNLSMHESHAFATEEEALRDQAMLVLEYGR